MCSEHKKRDKSKQKKEVENKVEKNDTKEAKPAEKQKPVKKIIDSDSEDDDNIPKSKILSHCSFKFKEEKSVELSNNDFWKFRGIKGSCDLIHLKTSLVVNIKDRKVFLIGLNINGSVYEKCHLPNDILKWCDGCGIIVDEDGQLDELDI